jgi:uncharacterized protein DUF6538
MRRFVSSRPSQPAELGQEISQNSPFAAVHIAHFTDLVHSGRFRDCVMQGLPHVRMAAGTFVFRRKVPADLIKRLGRFEIVRSLKTRSRNEARRRSRRLWIQTEEIFAVLTAEPNDNNRSSCSNG